MRAYRLGEGGARRESCAAFQAEGTPCPNARERESPHGTVFGFVAAENVREERDKAREPGPGSPGS